MCVLTFQLLCTSIDPCLCREILDVYAKLFNSFVAFLPVPHPYPKSPPQLHTLLQVCALGGFAGLLSDPDRSGDTSLYGQDEEADQDRQCYVLLKCPQEEVVLDSALTYSISCSSESPVGPWKGSAVNLSFPDPLVETQIHAL